MKLSLQTNSVAIFILQFSCLLLRLVVATPYFYLFSCCYLCKINVDIIDSWTKMIKISIWNFIKMQTWADTCTGWHFSVCCCDLFYFYQEYTKVKQNKICYSLIWSNVSFYLSLVWSDNTTIKVFAFISDGS